MRICSLLPSATKIVASLGLAESLVAVSEERDWPPEVRGLPVLTASRVDTARLSSFEIDQAVRGLEDHRRSLAARATALKVGVSPQATDNRLLNPIERSTELPCRGYFLWGVRKQERGEHETIECTSPRACGGDHRSGCGRPRNRCCGRAR